MPINPKTLEGIGTALLYPLAALKLRLLSAKGEPRIPGKSLVPYQITPKMVETLKKKNLDSLTNLAAGQAVDPVNTMKAVDPVLSSLYANILKNTVIRNGKVYGRIKDSNINALSRIDAPILSDVVKKVSPKSAQFLSGANAPIYGRNPLPSEKILDISSDYRGTVQNNALLTTGIVAQAMKDVGIKTKNPVLVNAGNSLHTKPSQYVNSTDSITLNNPLIATPTHELFHVKDFKSHPISKKLVKDVGDVLSASALAGAPVSILYGDRIAKEIPGSIDDAIINAYKYAGPEMWLAGKAMSNASELYAVKNTKNVISKNPEYWSALSSAMGIPASPEQLMSMQDVKGRSYPSMMATKYGLMRLGTIPLYLSKESSALPSVKVTPADYGNATKGQLLKYINSIKGIATGIFDKNLWGGVMYHDSANKYPPISKSIPLSTLAAMVPLVALGEYYKDVKKPKQNAFGPDYEKDIKQGLGA